MTTKKSYNLRLFENDIESIKAIAFKKAYLINHLFLLLFIKYKL